MSLGPKTTEASLIKYNLPSFLMSEFEKDGGVKFIKFLEYYMEWMEQEDHPIDVIKNMAAKKDVDEAPQQYLEVIWKFLDQLFPKNTLADKRIIIKNMKDFFSAKGSEESFTFIFSAVFGEEEMEKYDNIDRLLKPSISSYTRKTIVSILTEKTVDMSECIGQQLYQPLTRSRGFIETILTKDYGTKYVHIIELKHDDFKGNFQPFIDVTSTNRITGEVMGGYVTPSIINVLIDKNSPFNKVGQYFSVISDVGKEANFKVSAVSSGRIDDIKIIRKGKGYAVGDKITAVGKDAYGEGFDAEVETIDGIGAVLEPVLEIDQFVLESGGGGYKVGDVLFVDNTWGTSNKPAKFTVSSISNVTSSINKVTIKKCGSGYYYSKGMFVNAINNTPQTSSTIDVSVYNNKSILIGTVYAKMEDTLSLGGVNDVQINYVGVSESVTKNTLIYVNGFGCYGTFSSTGGVISGSATITEAGLNYVKPKIKFLSGNDSGSFTITKNVNGAITGIAVENGGKGHSATEKFVIIETFGPTMGGGAVLPATTGSTTTVVPTSKGCGYKNPVIISSTYGKLPSYTISKNEFGGITSVVFSSSIPSGHTFYVMEDYISNTPDHAIIVPEFASFQTGTNAITGLILSEYDSGEYTKLGNVNKINLLDQRVLTNNTNSYQTNMYGRGAVISATFKIKKVNVKNPGICYTFEDGVNTNLCSVVADSTTVGPIVVCEFDAGDLIGVYLKTNGKNVPKNGTLVLDLQAYETVGTVAAVVDYTIDETQQIIKTIEVIDGSGYNATGLIEVPSHFSSISVGTYSIVGNNTGAITGAKIISGGSGYESDAVITPLTLTVTATGGDIVSPAELLPILSTDSVSDLENKKLSGITVFNVGNGYTHVPYITLTGEDLNGNPISYVDITHQYFVPVLYSGMLIDVQKGPQFNNLPQLNYGTKIFIDGDGDSAAVSFVVNTGITHYSIKKRGVGCFSSDGVYKLPTKNSEVVQPSRLADIEITVKNLKLHSIKIIDGGEGYLTPVVDYSKFDAPDQLEVDLYCKKNIKSINVVSQGFNYTNANATIVGDGVGAKIKLQIDLEGGVQSVTPSGSTGLVAVPKLVVSDNSNHGSISKIKIKNKGYGYKTLPYIKLPVPDPDHKRSNAKFYVSSNSIGRITEVEFESFGYGYSETPVITTPFSSIVENTRNIQIGSKVYSESYPYTKTNISSYVTEINVLNGEKQVTFEVSSTCASLGIYNGYYIEVTGNALSLMNRKFKITDIAPTYFVVEVSPYESTTFTTGNIKGSTTIKLYNPEYGPKAIVNSIDSVSNIVYFEKATDLFKFVTESGDTIISQDGITPIEAEYSFNILPGSVLVDDITGERIKQVVQFRSSAKPILGGSASTKFAFTKETGVLNNKLGVIADNQRYQEFSYIIRSGMSTNTYKSVITNTVHPAGYAVFGDVDIRKYTYLTKVRNPLLDSSGKGVSAITKLVLIGAIDRTSIRDSYNKKYAYQNRFLYNGNIFLDTELIEDVDYDNITEKTPNGTVNSEIVMKLTYTTDVLGTKVKYRRVRETFADHALLNFTNDIMSFGEFTEGSDILVSSDNLNWVVGKVSKLEDNGDFYLTHSLTIPASGNIYLINNSKINLFDVNVTTQFASSNDGTYSNTLFTYSYDASTKLVKIHSIGHNIIVGETVGINFIDGINPSNNGYFIVTAIETDYFYIVKYTQTLHDETIPYITYLPTTLNATNISGNLKYSFNYKEKQLNPLIEV